MDQKEPRIPEWMRILEQLKEKVNNLPSIKN